MASQSANLQGPSSQRPNLQRPNSQRVNSQKVICDTNFASCVNDILIKTDSGVHYIEPDGNSFFTALVKSGAFPPQKTHQMLRNEITSHLQELAKTQASPLGDGIKYIRKSYTWGLEVANEVEKHASAAFGIHLIIYDVHDEKGKIVITQITYQNANATVPVVSLLRTGFSRYSALTRLPSEKAPRARKIAHAQSDGEVLRLSVSYILSSTPKMIRYLPSNTGESTVKGLQSSLNNNTIFNVELTSHRQLKQEVTGQLEKSGLERNEPIMERTTKNAWYNTIQELMTNRAPKEPHLTLLELCKNHPMHRCLRAIHHYFGAFMDHCHDWKKITWCVLSGSVRTDTERLMRMVDGLSAEYTKKDELKKWITKWREELYNHIRTGDGVNEKRCREYLIELNEEYIRLVNDPEIMVKEPLAYWLPTNFYHTAQKTWEFSYEERAVAMKEMKTYLEGLGIRALYLESGANWMENILDPTGKKPGNTAMTLDQILESKKLHALGLWPHATYNAAPCGKTFCSAQAGPCETTCSIPMQMDSMTILGAEIDVIVKGNRSGVNLAGISPEHTAALVAKGGILIRKGGAYILRPGDPIELSLNALSKEIEDSIGHYSRGDVNRSRVTELELLYSANLTIGLRDEMVTILKTWTDAVQLRGVSALKMKIMEKSINSNIIALLTLDNMCMESAVTEDIPYVIFSSSIRLPKDGTNDAITKHRYTFHCFDNTAIAENEAAIFNRKATTFAWICDKVVTGELVRMLDMLLENKEKQLRLVADSVADHVMFLACHQIIDSIPIHKRLAHKQCNYILNLTERMNTPDNATKRIIQNMIETGPLTPSATLEHFASLRALSEKFETSMNKMSETMNALSDVFTPHMFLDSYTAARQDVRNSGITNIEQEIEVYAVCMMVMEYVKMVQTNYNKVQRELLHIHTIAFEMIKIEYNAWEDREFYQTNKTRKYALGFDGFKSAWAISSKSIDTAPQALLQRFRKPANIDDGDEKTAERGIQIILNNPECKDILKATSMCLYILNKMNKKGSDLSYAALNETYNETMTNQERKQEDAELEKYGKRARFQAYYEPLQEHKKTFTLRMVGVPFATFVKACLEDPNLYCKDCPKEKECVVCTATSCRVVGHSSNLKVSNVSKNAAMNTSAPPAPQPPAPLGRSESSSTKRKWHQNQNQRTINRSNVSSLVQAAASSSTMNTNKKGGTRKRARKTHKRHQRKRQTRNRKARKTRKN